MYSVKLRWISAALSRVVYVSSERSEGSFHEQQLVIEPNEKLVRTWNEKGLLSTSIRSMGSSL